MDASPATVEAMFAGLTALSSSNPEPVLTKATTVSAALLATKLEANTTYTFVKWAGGEGWVVFDDHPTLCDAVQMFAIPSDDARFDASHPGLHRGVRAKIDIPKNTFVCSYSAAGVITTSRLDDHRDLGVARGEVGRLSMTYNWNCQLLPSSMLRSPNGLSITVVGNPLGVALGPLVNDCRGTAHDKNCDIVMVLRTGATPRVPVTLEAKVMTIAPISKGQELLTKYGDAYWEIMDA